MNIFDVNLGIKTSAGSLYQQLFKTQDDPDFVSYIDFPVKQRQDAEYDILRHKRGPILTNRFA